MRYRHEYKYIIDAPQEAILRVRMGGILQSDPHTDDSGAYMVRSAYLDDCFDSCLNDNLLGAEPRSKFRLRYYGDDSATIRLEKKVKRGGMTCKAAVPLTPAECERLLAGEIPLPEPDAPALKQRLLTEVLQRGLKPKTIVTYERVPFVYPGGNVRVTFDRMLTSADDVGRFLTRDHPARPVLPAGQSILEVKWDELLPSFIRQTLRLEGLQWTACSKYYLCRAVHL